MLTPESQALGAIQRDSSGALLYLALPPHDTAELSLGYLSSPSLILSLETSDRLIPWLQAHSLRSV